MNFLRFNMDKLSLCQMVYDVINNNIDLAFKDVKIFFQSFCSNGSVILPFVAAVSIK